jgi:DNA invertase Pin-like site-specific DNA recombinase
VRSEGESERRAELEAKLRALRAACRRQGWQLLAEEEAGLAARELEPPARPQARRGRTRAPAPALVVAGKRERPAQALLELVALVESAQEQGFALVALECTCETQTPAGAVANVRATFAPCERRLISKRTRAALARTRAQGVRLGRPPSMSPYALERIRRERAAGKSLAAIAEGLNADRIPTAQGGRRWYPATVRYTLTRAQ